MSGPLSLASNHLRCTGVGYGAGQRFPGAWPGGLVALLALAAGGAAADEPVPPARLDTIVVVNTGSPRPIRDVVGTVTVIEQADARRLVATSPADLWRYVPGIEVESSGSRFPAQSLSIRGIGGNRVTTEVDGIPVQDRFVVGSFADAGRSLTDIDFVKRIEVLHGPASSLYGSSAIGGVVAVTTPDPDDLSAGDGWAHGTRAAWAGDADAVGASAIGAWQRERAGVLVGVARRRAGEGDRSAGPAVADEVRQDGLTGLAKLTLDDTRGGRGRLTLTGDRESTTSDLRSIAGVGRFANTTSLTGDDETSRAGVAVDYDLPLGNSTAWLAAWYRDTSVRQDTVDVRPAARRPVRVERSFRFDTTDAGLRARIGRRLDRGDVSQQLAWGIEYRRRTLEESRDALETGLADGQSSSTVLGETFPLRDFPATTVAETGVFVQDEIGLGRWTLIPGVRLDDYRLDARADAAWRAAWAQTPAVDLHERAVSPRIGILYAARPQLQYWVQYAEGFRAPPAEDVNIGLDIPLFNVRALPNPELQSEQSAGWELGVRVAHAGAWLSLAGFQTDYEDFIVSRSPVGVDPESGTLLFQSVNLDRARIRGAELAAGLPLRQVAAALDGLELGLAAYWADGDDRRSGESLDDVGPPTATVTLGWTSPAARWQATLAGTFAARHERAASEAPGFEAPGRGVLDLLLGWRPTPRLALNAAIFNLGDKTWWRWTEVRGLPADDPLVPALSAAGRGASVSLSYGFGTLEH